MAPEIVGRVLASPGHALPKDLRSSMESRFGYNFAHVRVHHDATAQESTRAVNAHAYTVGSDLVFASGKYAPHSVAGRQLLVHELAHVVQQRAGTSSRRVAESSIEIAPGGPTREEAEAENAARASSQPRVGRPVRPQPPSVQRQAAGGEEKRHPNLLGGSAPQLHLDPELQAQSIALQTRGMLDPLLLRLSLDRMNLDAVLGAPPPPWATIPAAGKTPEPVPRGEGPAIPRTAGVGDLLKAVLAVPAVDTALTRLQTEAADRGKTDWRSLSAGEKAAVITQSALIGGGAVAGLLSNPQARQFTLDLLQNRPLPTGVPGLSLQFNLTGPDQRVQFDLNLGHFLPKQWGFR
jgi:hypothetical protein